MEQCTTNLAYGRVKRSSRNTSKILAPNIGTVVIQKIILGPSGDATMSKSIQVYTCQTCSALFLCLKFYQDHRIEHAKNDEEKTLYTCSYCDLAHEDESEHRWHVVRHQGQEVHRCSVCQPAANDSDGTTNLVLDNNNPPANNNKANNVKVNQEESEDSDDDDESDDDTDDDEDDDDDDEDDDDDDSDSSDDDSDDSDDDDDDDSDDDSDEEDDETEDDDENKNVARQQVVPMDISTDLPLTAPNSIPNTNDTCTNATSNASPTKPSRPSRSTGKGKGNRKARPTSDGDTRRKFMCAHCGKSFKTKSHLQRHILTHTGERPYLCNQCGNKFNQSSSLRNHVIAIHTKEYPHTCTNCHKGFLMPALLQKHLQSSPSCGATMQVVEM
ncbi:Zinc finger protein 358, partial [Fragariocoptes setiger]